MDAEARAVIAATLCGCVLDDLACDTEQVTLTLHEPRQGRLTLVCREAVLLNDAGIYDALPAQPRWKRTIDWVDLLDKDVFYLCFQDGATLALRAGHAAFTHAIGV